MENITFHSHNDDDINITYKNIKRSGICEIFSLNMQMLVIAIWECSCKDCQFPFPLLHSVIPGLLFLVFNTPAAKIQNVNRASVRF